MTPAPPEEIVERLRRQAFWDGKPLYPGGSLELHNALVEAADLIATLTARLAAAEQFSLDLTEQRDDARYALRAEQSRYEAVCRERDEAEDLRVRDTDRRISELEKAEAALATLRDALREVRQLTLDTDGLVSGDLLARMNVQRVKIDALLTPSGNGEGT